ncbi:MAG: DUF3147 family protein [Xanthobacteraceae bacterium]
MTDTLARFLIGGLAVSFFAALADVLRPRSFAGLFGAAPSIALATLTTVAQRGAPFAAEEGRSMIVGALALAACSAAVCLLIQRGRWHANVAALTGIAVWFVVAFGLGRGAGLL